MVLITIMQWYTIYTVNVLDEKVFAMSRDIGSYIDVTELSLRGSCKYVV